MRRAALALLLTTALAPSCSPRKPSAATVDAALATSEQVPTRRDANGRLDDLVREHLDASFAESPTTATWLGVHAWDDRLDDASADAEARRLTRVRATLDRLHEIPESELDVSHRFDRALLERDLRVAILELTQDRPLERNPAWYVDVVSYGLFLPLERDGAPLVERMRSIVARLWKVRAFLDDGRRNLKNPPELVTRRAVELAQSARAFVDDTLRRVVSALGDERLAADFKPAQTDALRGLDDWLAWLQKDLLPRSHGDLALGRDRLVERLRTSELVDVPLDQLVATADRALKTAQHALEDVAHEITPGKTPSDAVRALEEDHPAADDVQTAVGVTLDAAIAFVRDHRLVTLPEARPKVAEMPPYLWGPIHLSAAGPLEQKPHDALLYVEPLDEAWDQKRRDEHLRALPRPLLALTVIHEVMPGHFLQEEVQRHDPSLMQRASHSASFVEGWAGYVEDMMLDAGYGEGQPGLRLEHLRGQVVRLCRLEGALRFHGQGAKLDEVTRLFADAASLYDFAARREAERVATDPMSLADALGRLELVKLLDDYRRAKGESFVLHDFHDKVLSYGAPPPALLRKTLLPGDAAPPL